MISILGDEGMGKTKLDYAMKVHMQRIVRVEKRPFCYRDFLEFELDGIRYSMTHETFRNKISTFIKNGLVQLVFLFRSCILQLKRSSFC